MYPPAPTPDQSLESAEAPLSSLGRGRRQGRLLHHSYTGSNIYEHILYKLKSIQSINCNMYACPPAATPHQSLQSAEAHYLQE